MLAKKPNHLLLRFSDNLYKVNTISEHKELIEDQGAVWFGKIGIPIAEFRIALLKKQIEQKIPTYLILVQNKSGKYQIHRGNIVDITRSCPQKEAELIPNYYTTHKLSRLMNSWIKISNLDELDANYLASIKGIESVDDMLTTLKTSNAGMFYVKEIASHFS